jgi:hypothetical protein
MAVEDIGASLGQVDEPDRYRGRLGLASSEGEPDVEATNRLRGAGESQVRRRDIICVFRERLSDRPADHIGLTSEGHLHFLDKQTGAATPAG